MVAVTTLLIDARKGSSRKKRIITKPPLDDIQRDFIQVVKAMHDATKGILRTEQKLFPKLQLKNPYLAEPDIGADNHLKNIVKMIDKLIE